MQGARDAATRTMNATTVQPNMDPAAWGAQAPRQLPSQRAPEMPRGSREAFDATAGFLRTAPVSRAAPGSGVSQTPPTGPTGAERFSDAVVRGAQGFWGHLQDRAGPAPGSGVTGPTDRAGGSTVRGVRQPQAGSESPGRPAATGSTLGGAAGATAGAAAGLDTSQMTRIPGIYQRPGADDGVTEFYNMQDGRVPDRLSGGTVSYAPAGAVASLAVGGNSWRDRQALHEAGMAAMRRGDHPDQIAAARARAGGGRDRATELFERAAEAADRAAQAGTTSDRARYNRQSQRLIQTAQGLSGHQDARTGRGLESQRQQFEQAQAQEAVQLAAEAGPDAQDILRLAQARNYDARTQQTIAEVLRDDAMDDMPEIPTNVLQMIQNQNTPEDMRQSLETTFERQIRQHKLRLIASENQMNVSQLMEGWASGAFEGSDLQNVLEDMLVRNRGGEEEVEGYADGGYIPSATDMSMEASMGPFAGAMGMEGEAMATGYQAGPDPVEAEYQAYAQGAQQMGLPLIPFDDYINLRQQQVPQAPDAPGATEPMGAMGFAMGGPVPDPNDMRGQTEPMGAMGFAMGGPVPDPADVSGKMVVDPDPGAPTDSIPAIIDGQRPAALDSGEFVIPDHVVRWHGIDKLNKLIQQAEQGGAHGADGNSTATGAAMAG